MAQIKLGTPNPNSKKEEQKKKQVRSLRKSYLKRDDVAFFKFLLNRQDLAKLFRCKCWHYDIVHEEKTGKCLMPNCPYKCFEFREKEFFVRVPFKDLLVKMEKGNGEKECP